MRKKIKSSSPAQIYVVDASAGSGKTFALAKHYLKLLFSSEWPLPVYVQNILGITFTNKAAIEMKERIINLLKKLVFDTFSKEEKRDIISYIGLPENIIREKANIVLEQIIKNYSFFQIRTIDSFINLLITSCIFYLERAPNFKIVENYKRYIQYTLDLLLDKISTDGNIKKIFKNFLISYLEQEDDVKKKWDPKKDIFIMLNDLFYYTNIYGTNFVKIDFNSPFFELENFCDKPESKKTRKKESVSEIKKEQKFLYEKVFTLYNPYIDIFNLFITEMKNITKKENVIFLEELNKQVRTIYDRYTYIVPEIYYRLATRILHYLIDEFQDTSVLQWRNLFPLIEEAISTGGSLYYVGDKKQAIYSFRGGEPILFDTVKDKFSHYKVSYRTLDINYRSQKTIVEFNSQLFSHENLSRYVKKFNYNLEEVIYVYSNVKQQYVEGKNKGYVRVELIPGENIEERKIELRPKLVNLINELRERNLTDIAILVRRNSEVELISEWLLEDIKGIRVESEKTLSVKENPLIKEIVAFLKFLISPEDNLSFTSFISGKIFTTAVKINVEEIHNFIVELQDNKEIYKEFKKRYPEVWKNWIEEIFLAVSYLPVYDLVIKILVKFNILKNFSDNYSFFAHFLNLIKLQEEENNTLDSFIEYFETTENDQMYVNISGEDSVKIMTVHKAKGLEFSAVIVPFLTHNVRIGSGRNRKYKFIIKFDEDRDNLYLLYLNKENVKNCEKLKKLYEEEYKKVFIEELNNIYVSFTRAKDELYIFVGEKYGNGKNIAQYLFTWNGQSVIEYGEKQVYPKNNIEKKLPSWKEISIPEYIDWFPLMEDEFTEWKEIINREKILKGDVLHKILSFISVLYEKNIDRIVYEAVEKTKFYYPYIKDWNEYVLLIKKLLDSSVLTKFFYLDPTDEVYLEKEIVTSSGETFRIDRLIIKLQEVWVVDYKSSEDEFQEDVHQVKRYKNIVQEIYPEKKVKGYIVYFDTLSLKEI